ncbi:hypothetical protein ANN_05069 [Periplaneta americana]|uniref:Uncharacterized protein n=1 Tax=Periplaneta americana TaxID=6978 RepID=A0ABQ8TBR3_PERAM|nr:hypothetical protein ANN_05069 [Periplaneta americana]
MSADCHVRRRQRRVHMKSKFHVNRLDEDIRLTGDSNIFIPKPNIASPNVTFLEEVPDYPTNELMNILKDVKDKYKDIFGEEHMMRPEDVARAVALYDDGRSVRYIANVMNMARSTTHDAIKRYRETLEYTRRPGSDRPKATNKNEDRYMVLRVLRERNLPATSVA